LAIIPASKKLREKGSFEEWIKTWAFWLFSPRTFESAFVETFIKLAVKYPYHASATGFQAQAGAMAKFDARGRLSNIRAKTLVIEGEDDILIRPEEARVLAKKISGSRIRLVKNSAHYVHLENPSLFMKIAEGFL